MKKIKDLEILLMKNISFVTLFLIVVILSIDILPHLINKIYGTNYNFISTIQTISTIGAILAFWYGFKKYERDKEIEVIDKYQLGKLTIENFDDDITKLAIAYKLYQKGYLSDFIWELIEIKNNDIIYKFLYENLYKKNDIKYGQIANKLNLLEEYGLLNYFKNIIEKIIINMEHDIDNNKVRKKDSKDVPIFLTNIQNILKLLRNNY